FAADSAVERTDRARALATRAEQLRLFREARAAIDCRAARLAIKRVWLERLAARPARAGLFSGVGCSFHGRADRVREIFAAASASKRGRGGLGAAVRAGDLRALLRLLSLETRAARFAEHPSLPDLRGTRRTGVEFARYPLSLTERLATPLAVAEPFRKIDVASFAVHVGEGSWPFPAPQFVPRLYSNITSRVRR